MAKKTNDPLDTTSGIANTGVVGIVTEIANRPQTQTWADVSGSPSAPPPAITAQSPQGTTPFARSTQVAGVNAPTWQQPSAPAPAGPLRSAVPPAPVIAQRTPDTMRVGQFGAPRQEVPEPSIDIDTKSIGAGPIARIAGQQFNADGQARDLVRERTAPMGVQEATARGIIAGPDQAQQEADTYARAFRGGGMSTQMVSDAAGRLGSDMNLGMRETGQNTARGGAYRRIDPNSVQAQQLNAQWEDAREAALKGSMSDQAWTKREGDRNAQLMRRVQREGATPQALAQARQIAGAVDVERAKSVVEAEKSARDAEITRGTKKLDQLHQEKLASASVYAQQAKQDEAFLNTTQGFYLPEEQKAVIREDIRANMERAKRANPALDVGEVTPQPQPKVSNPTDNASRIKSIETALKQFPNDPRAKEAKEELKRLKAIK